MDKPIQIVQFGSKHCPPCKSIQQKILDWLSFYQNDVDYVYHSIDECPEIAAKEGVFSVPALLVFVQGQLTIREIGFFSLRDILSRTEFYLDFLKDNPDC